MYGLSLAMVGVEGTQHFRGEVDLSMEVITAVRLGGMVVKDLNVTILVLALVLAHLSGVIPSGRLFLIRPLCTILQHPLWL